MKEIKDIHVLIPTLERVKAVAVTLSSLCFQTEKSFQALISDQSFEDCLMRDHSIQTIIRLLELHEHPVSIIKNLPAKGMAQGLPSTRPLRDPHFHRLRPLNPLASTAIT